MRLRNKKTGGIVKFLTIDLTGEGEIEFCFVAPDGDECCWKYNSLAELNEEWEDYKPKEPLIKDVKVRKAVRAWAEANDIESAFITMDENMDWSVYGDDADRNRFRTQFFDRVVPDKNINHRYTITELCGEEE